MIRPGERNLRAAVFFALVFGAGMLRAVDPATVDSAWLPFATSCGAVTGLPCLFCGMTRALHHLLNAELGRALYFNWLAFPFASAALLIAAGLGAEIVTARRFLPRTLTISARPDSRCEARNVARGPSARGWAVAVAVLVGLWLVQVSLAVAQHKQELLNPRGPLYALLVR